MSGFDKLYLEDAQDCLGQMLDCAVNAAGISLEECFSRFIAGDFARRFAAGDPAVISGMSGRELAMAACGLCGTIPVLESDSRSPEFWTGWALAYFQWESGRSFADIVAHVSVTTIRLLYSPYHEMDISHFVRKMHELIADVPRCAGTAVASEDPMKHIIYHGSPTIVKEPIFGYGNPYNDYGLGFYCTRHDKLAREWAVDSQHDGYINKYDLAIKNLSILNLNDGSYSLMHWLAILLANRKVDMTTPLSRQGRDYILKHFSLDCRDADVIIGYRADDSYFSFVRDFLSNRISCKQLNRAMCLGQLGQQVVIKSEKAFNALKFLGYDYVDRKEWYPKKAERDLRARNDYASGRTGIDREEVFILDIIRQDMQANDPHLRFTVPDDDDDGTPKDD